LQKGQTRLSGLVSRRDGIKSFFFAMRDHAIADGKWLSVLSGICAASPLRRALSFLSRPGTINR
jgi:hypothetical protein